VAFCFSGASNGCWQRCHRPQKLFSGILAWGIILATLVAIPLGLPPPLLPLVLPLVHAASGRSSLCSVCAHETALSPCRCSAKLSGRLILFL